MANDCSTIILQGSAGATGPQGPQGIQGIPGDTGPQGVKGDTGPQGPIGITGATGAIGGTGPRGLVGPQGIQGARGATGATGPIGPQGAAGVQGPIGPTGLQGQSFVPNDKGDFTDAQQAIIVGPPLLVIAPRVYLYLVAADTRTVTGGAYLPAGRDGHLIGYDGTNWTDYGSIVGVAGAIGAAGATGAVGPQGTPGPIGPQGTTGPAGVAGTTGANGLTGSTGATGAAGPVGPQGNDGPAGANAGGSNFVEDYGAISSGTIKYLSTVTHNVAGSNFGVAYGSGAYVGGANQALADIKIRWSLVTEPYSIDTFTISNSLTINNNDKFSIQIGANIYDYIAVTGDTVRLVATSIRNYGRIGYGNVVPGNLIDRDLTSSVVSDLNVITLYTRSPTVAIPLINGVASADFTVTRSKTYGLHKLASTGDIATTALNWISIQQALKKMEQGLGYSTLNFGYGGTYIIDRPLELPLISTRSMGTFIYEGNGSSINMPTGTKFNQMICPVYTTKQAVTTLSYSMVFNNLELQGVGTPKDITTTQSVGLRAVGIFNLQINGCNFNRFDTALDLQFVLRGTINSCKFIQNRDCGSKIRWGQWTNTSLAESPSNGIKFDGCRFFSVDAATHSLKFEAAQSCNVTDCIFEGGYSKNAVYWSNYATLLGHDVTTGALHTETRSTTTKNFIVQNSYVEQFYVDSTTGLDGFFADIRGGDSIVSITNIFPQKCTKLVRNEAPTGAKSRVLLSVISYYCTPPAGINPLGFLKSIGSTATWRIMDVMVPSELAGNPAGTGQPSSAASWIDSNRTRIWDKSSTNGQGIIPAAIDCSVPFLLQ